MSLSSVAVSCDGSLGRGANVALRDAVSLSRTIQGVEVGELELGIALREYESAMTKYGFYVVRYSAEMGARLLGQDPLK